MSYLNKSIKERIFHAVLFELLANLLIILMMCLTLSVTARSQRCWRRFPH
ncbi:chlorhexidine efflux transporter [Erwinia mallotivora]